MRIAVSCHPTQGGSGIVASELASALARSGHEVHLVSAQRPFRFQEDSGVRFHEVNVLDYPLFQYPPYDLSLANRLAGITKEFGIEIIHAHYAVPHAVAALLARDVVSPHGVRVVTTLHGTDITLVGSHKDFYDLTRHAMIHSDAVTAVSWWLRDETMNRFSLPNHPEVITNFVDTARFNPEGRVEYPAAGGEFNLVHASNLRPVKRLCDIVRVFHLVQRDLPARLSILGEGPEKGNAEELVAELDLCDRVSFRGMTDDMPSVLRSAHLYLLLSDHESFGLSALEAMACGAPAAVTSEGGSKEIVTEDTGILCPVGNVETTAREIRTLLTDEKRWKSMSAACTVRAKEKFDADVIVPQYEVLYERVLEKETRA
jgi:N-acetyl-alpha-D-glucosaminyl L-malate synthase BshA